MSSQTELAGGSTDAGATWCKREPPRKVCRWQMRGLIAGAMLQMFQAGAPKSLELTRQVLPGLSEQADVQGVSLRSHHPVKWWHC